MQRYHITTLNNYIILRDKTALLYLKSQLFSTFSATLLISTAISPPEFPIPITSTLFPCIPSALRYSQLWKCLPSKLSIPELEYERVHGYIAACRWYDNALLFLFSLALAKVKGNTVYNGSWYLWSLWEVGEAGWSVQYKLWLHQKHESPSVPVHSPSPPPTGLFWQSLRWAWHSAQCSDTHTQHKHTLWIFLSILYCLE